MTQMADGTYLLKNEASALYLGVRDGDNGSTVELQEPATDFRKRERQLWTVEDRGDGKFYLDRWRSADSQYHAVPTFSLRNVYSGKYLRVPGDKAGASVEQVTPHGALSFDENATWAVEETPKKYWDFKGLLLGNIGQCYYGYVPDDRKDAGAPLSTDTMSVALNTGSWFFEPEPATGRPEQGGEEIGNRMDAYYGTYKGTFRRELCRGVPGDEATARLLSGVFDLTMRFFMDGGGQHKAEATFLRRESGAQPYTSVTDYVLGLTRVPKAVEFNAKGMDGIILGDRSGGNPNQVDVYSNKSVKDWIADQRSGVSLSGEFGFRLAALGSVDGTSKPQRLYESTTTTMGAGMFTVQQTTDLDRQD
ncbi:RICIN domain-containing protein [Streptomyces sp. bgisy130]|uniref:RICIN domain-containing protein n=1 Tax=Streptomyces sp. bgisy130 TaxID=3413788 RepID=UPI003F4A4ED1